MFRWTTAGEVLVADYGVQAAKRAAARKRSYMWDEEEAVEEEQRVLDAVKFTKLHEVFCCCVPFTF